MSEYIDQVELLTTEINTHKSSDKADFIKSTLHRILNYKDIYIHKDQLSPDVLNNSFSSLTATEKAICQHGLEAMNFTIHYLDELANTGNHAPEPRTFTVDRQTRFLSHVY